MIKNFEHRDFLMKDFKAIHDYQINFSSLRLGALGACLTILGLIISLGKNAEFPSIIGNYIIILVVVFASIRIIAAIHRGIFIFEDHIGWIEKKLGEVGFASYWRNYLQKRVEDSGSYAFMVATRLINLSISVYIFIGGLSSINYNDQANFKKIVVVSILAITLIMFLWNEYHIRKQLDPRGYIERIAKGLEKARAEAFEQLSD